MFGPHSKNEDLSNEQFEERTTTWLIPPNEMIVVILPNSTYNSQINKRCAYLLIQSLPNEDRKTHDAFDGGTHVIIPNKLI